GFHFYQSNQQQQRVDEQKMAQTLIETAPLPSTSLYSTIRQYIETEQVPSRWEFEHQPTGLYAITLSLMPAKVESKLPLYAFEVNLQAQSVRGVNTAAAKLLSEGFPRPTPKAAAAPAQKHKSPGDMFPGAINDRREAFEQGDFEAVWEMFSRQRKQEMS